MICKCCGKEITSWRKIISQDGTYQNMYSEECPYCGAPNGSNQNDDLDQLKRIKDSKIRCKGNQNVI